MPSKGKPYSMSIQILCDFDGTITHRDVTDGLLERFALPEWRLIEEDYLSGRMGSRECMLRQVDLIRADINAVDQFLDHEEVDPYFPDFVRFCRKVGWDLVVVSDGLDYAIHRILARHGLSHLTVYTNHLELLAHGRYRLHFPHANEACPKGSGTCKCALVKPSGRYRVVRVEQGVEMPGVETVLIGDGTSDYCLADNCDLVFAKDKLLEYCKGRDIPYLAYNDFSDVRVMMSKLQSMSSRPSADRPNLSHLSTLE